MEKSANEDPSGPSPKTSSSLPPPQLEVIKELRQHGVEATVKKYSLRSRKHAKHPNLVLFHYDFQCKFTDLVNQECRGLIVDTSDPAYPLVCLPYTKFFNHAEKISGGVASKAIDWKTAIVTEKLDGSIASLYYYGGEWHVASSNVPDGSANLSASGETFSQIFFDIWQSLRYPLPTDTSKVYLFEMLTNKNRIVCTVKEEAIILHGVRCMKTLQEERPEPIALQHGWAVVPVHPIRSLEEAIAFVKERPPFEHEGVVVCDAKFRRVKVKSPHYTAVALLSNQKHATNYQRMLHIIRIGESSEFLSYYPEMQATHDKVFEAYQQSLRELSKQRSSEEFGTIVTKFVQDMRSKKIPLHEYLREVDIKELWEVVELFMPTNPSGNTASNGSSSAKGKKGPTQQTNPEKEPEEASGKGKRGKKKGDKVEDVSEAIEKVEPVILKKVTQQQQQHSGKGQVCTGPCCAAPPLPNTHQKPKKAQKKQKGGKGKRDDDDDDEDIDEILKALEQKLSTGKVKK